MVKLVTLGAAGAAMLLGSAGVCAQPPSVHALEVSAVIHEQVGPAPRCATNFGGTIMGYGSSALLGHVAIISTDCITPVGPLFNFSDGKLILMTTSGDQIYANYSGQFVPTGEGAKYVLSGATFQITGGNGNFARASGGGSLSGGEDMATTLGTMSMSGSIRFKER